MLSLPSTCVFSCLVLPCLALLGAGCTPESGVDASRQNDHPTGIIAATNHLAASVASGTPELAKETGGVAQWPALFGSDRTSVVDAAINPKWPDGGPELIWQVDCGTGYGSPVTADGRVVFNSRVGDHEIVQCHDVATGELRWSYRYPTSAVCDFKYSDGPYSTPTIDATGRRVFNVGGQGQFSCLDFDTGKVVWVRDLHAEYGVQADIFPVGASPLLDRKTVRGDGQLIFNLGARDRSAGIISLNPDNGETNWQATDHGPSYGTPFVTDIHGQRFAFVLTDEGLVCLNPDDGSVDWNFEYRRKGDLVRNATSPLAFDDKVLVVSSGLGGVCLEVQPDRSYIQSWRQRRTLDSQYNTLILGNDQAHVYSFTSSGQGGAEFRCVDLKTGSLCWTYPSVLKRGMGLASGDALILLGERGHLASLAFTHQSPRVISFTAQPLMTEPCYCSPAIYDDRLILKDETRVAVFDLGS
ncbi:MAG: PQQ-like beta-propeller repeat protein [Planctomycetales bacterium]|nr:PQQ-like beta-propeller repeat protein [Planctomycetales bacterium]